MEFLTELYKTNLSRPINSIVTVSVPFPPLKKPTLPLFAFGSNSSSSSKIAALRETRELDYSRSSGAKMGKYIRKCKVLGDIAVMEVSPVGVRTRARTLALDTAETRKRARFLAPSPEDPSSPSNDAGVQGDRCPSPDHLQASRCSSSGSSELVNRPPRSEDPEGFVNAVDSGCKERRESTPSSHLQSESDELESTASPSAGNSRRKPTIVKMPSEGEIEEFFAAAEKEEKKRFTKKYNFDIAKEVPLEGRYEWVRLQ